MHAEFEVTIKIKKASKGHQTSLEAFISASSGKPLSWLSPRKLRVFEC